MEMLDTCSAELADILRQVLRRRVVCLHRPRSGGGVALFRLDAIFLSGHLPSVGTIPQPHCKPCCKHIRHIVGEDDEGCGLGADCYLCHAPSHASAPRSWSVPIWQRRSKSIALMVPTTSEDKKDAKGMTTA